PKDESAEQPVNDVEQNLDEEAVEQEDEELSQFPVEIEDNFGNKVTIEEEPEKIVSLDPSNTETLFALGLGDKVVGVSSNCNYPEEATTKEVVGDYEGTNLERIVELNPEIVLVYGAGNEDDNKILRDAGIKVLGFLPESIDEVVNTIKTVGKATGKVEEADELVKSMMVKKDEIIDIVKDEEEVKVFYEIWHDPLMGAGKGSFMDELITLSSGKNIAEDADGAYPQYDLEQLIERDVDVYLASQGMEDITIESIKARPGYDVIPAIKNNRIHLFQESEADMVSRPGPRIVDALEIVAKAIHPKAFQ
ncbi:MAG TPA: cobalamin-binding protein, partial [Tissierellaceae bacterium]|nr:cobalamin-binding protein [Tissierellaceae bacterium]